MQDILQKYGTGYKTHDDPIFLQGNYLIQPFIRLGVFQNYEEEESILDNSIFCNVPNCGEKFQNVNMYETHYNSYHLYFCQTCRKKLPSAHLLDLHLEETHDSFFAVKSEKKAMFSCYLKECDYKSWNQQERKDHCIKSHNFPHNFRFDKQSKSKINIVQTASGNSSSENSTDITMETDVATNVIQPQKLRNFNFGHQKVKTFAMGSTKPKNKLEEKKRTNILEDNTMVEDLMKNLPD